MVKEIAWPKFQQCLNNFGSMNQTFSEFIDSIINGVETSHIYEFDPEYYNVITPYMGKINLEIYHKMANENNKELKIYFYHLPVNINIYGTSPLIFDYVKIKGPVNLLVANNNVDFANRIAKKYGCDIMLYRFSSNDLDFSFIKNENITGRSLFTRNRTKTDIKLAEIIDYIDKTKDVFTALKNSVSNYIDNVKVEISLPINRTNILILCANTKTIKDESAKGIITNLLKSVNFENVDFYYLGIDINEISSNGIIRCKLNNFILNSIENPNKFDIIVSEHCPFFVIGNDLNRIYSIINDDGIFISPSYLNRIPNSNELFTEVISKGRYVGLKKIIKDNHSNCENSNEDRDDRDEIDYNYH